MVLTMLFEWFKSGMKDLGDIMSIEKIEMFTVICDNCKTSADDDTDYSCWNDEIAARDVAMEADYIYEDDKHYCPKCYEYNDEYELIINTERTK